MIVVIYQLRRAFRIPRGSPFLAFDPQSVLEEMGCFAAEPWHQD